MCLESKASTIMKMLLDDADLKPPEAIFVSPLQRALQTAAVMRPSWKSTGAWEEHTAQMF